MSADRLREAADVLEQPRDALGCSDPYECCLHSPTDEDTYPADRFETATAALLRAGAVMQDEYTDAEANARMFKALPIYHALHDLADIILGDSE